MSKRNRTREQRRVTRATDPGQITLSHDKLRVLRPDLYGIAGIWTSLRVLFRRDWSHREYVEKQLQNGDSRAAVVISTVPLRIAAYTDEFDCIAMLRFPNDFVRQYRLSVGSRLLTVNYYSDSPTYDADLILGPQMIRRWTGFHPLIADFLTEDFERLQARKKQIAETEWQRAQVMGTNYITIRPGVARDGRPVYARIPATIKEGT